MSQVWWYTRDLHQWPISHRVLKRATFVATPVSHISYKLCNENIGMKWIKCSQGSLNNQKWNIWTHQVKRNLVHNFIPIFILPLEKHTYFDETWLRFEFYWMHDDRTGTDICRTRNGTSQSITTMYKHRVSLASLHAWLSASYKPMLLSSCMQIHRCLKICTYISIWMDWDLRSMHASNKCMIVGATYLHGKRFHIIEN